MTGRQSIRRYARPVLICRFSAIGDVAMTIPVVYSVCRSNPDRDFILITKPVSACLFLELPPNLTLHPVDTTQYRGVTGIRRLADKLYRTYRPEMMADLHGVIRSRLLRLFLSMRGVKVRHIRKQRRGKRALTRRRSKVMMPLISTRARYREVFFSLGLAYKEVFMGYFHDTVPNPDLFAAATPPKQADETWIAIAPFAGHRGKIYPLELMTQIVQTLAQRQRTRIFMLGAGTDEANIIGRWALSHDNVVNMAALHLGFEAEMHLLRYCDAMISMDSGNMHIASLVRLRVISIWGATHPFCGFMGWKQHKEDAVQLDMVCRPCSVYGNKPCHRGDFHCMYGIRPELIIKTLDRHSTKTDTSSK